MSFESTIGFNGFFLDDQMIGGSRAWCLRLRARCVYIGRIISTTSYIDIKHDRILLANLSNDTLSNKYNITVPYTDISAMRYCFNSDISAIFIQPVSDSYIKLSNWLDLPYNVRRIPENFTMIRFEEKLSKELVSKLKVSARECNSTIKIIEINSAFALDYLNQPNKLFPFRTSIENSITKKLKTSEEEVIHLDDDDDDDDENGKTSDGQSILSQSILRYPENESNPIILYGNDLNCLREGHFLNDNIMNFYLKYYQSEGNIKQEINDKIHIYDALFATHLANVNARKRKITFANNTLCSYDTLEQAYHSVLKKWTKDIDIFAKDFLLIPLVKDSHWFLIILCYIGNVIFNSDVISADEIKKPTIIFMDSLANHLNRNDIRQSILSYLSLELKEKRGLDINCNRFNFKILYPKVPMQTNHYDCGLFVLQYIEQFLQKPEEIYMKLIKDSSSLKNWFNHQTLVRKREKIRLTILNLLPPDEAKKLESELTRIHLIDFDN